MKVENAKWELEILLKQRLELVKVNLNLDYDENNRIKELRKFIDTEEVEIVQSKKPFVEDYPF